MRPPGVPPLPPLLLLLPLLLLAPCCRAVGRQPEQIHLSFTPTHCTSVTVTYSTADEWETVVRYGRAQLDSQNTGFSTLFVQGADHHQQYIHRVNLTGLEPGEQYSYQVSGPEGWSDVFQFSAMKPGIDWSPRLVVYGDLGSVNARSLPQLEEDTQKGLYDAALHVGDFAYDMDSDQGYNE
ncbi:acid phosphatase type 7-like [Pollicipes pollicipes]|uniref:acid phosphatase type 7-like n=1 Tax=Pollicipes pollicipes TaxID=41117 RepID=UPI001884AB40|nr:acid phosphatase type 7-like [Pollicipes pollicipes]